jgi:uncharacterized SAM-binding protein YcdF (DUF218 family)
MGLDTFYLKAVIGRLFYPESLALLVLLIGFFWVWKTGSRTGVFLIALGCISAVIASLPITGFLLIRPLEIRAGPAPDPGKMVREGVRNIVVLNDIPSVTELWKKMPDSTLTISPGYCRDKQLEVALKKDMPRRPIVVDTKARDTEDQARLLRPLLEGQTFALVTWAGHMPRALMIFRRLKLHPAPAPMEFAKFPAPWSIALRPSAEGLLLTRKALHEYVGILWQLLKATFA